jgi:hypothetical protein
MPFKASPQGADISWFFMQSALKIKKPQEPFSEVTDF